MQHDTAAFNSHRRDDGKQSAIPDITKIAREGVGAELPESGAVAIPAAAAPAFDKGVPIPDPAPNRKVRYGAMQVNDSEFFSSKTGARNACVFIRSLGFYATMRKVEGGYRVWRVA